MNKKTREDRRQDRKDSIKEAAIEVFSSHGYHAAKVSQIVKKVGVAQGTFYLYYKSKEELFGELLFDFLESVFEVISDWDPSGMKDAESLRDSIFKIGISLTSLFVEHEELATIFFREGLGVNAEFNRVISEFYERVANVLCRFHRILYRRGFIKRMNFELTAWIIIGAAERVVREYTVSKRLRDISPQEIVEHLLFFYISGVNEPLGEEIEIDIEEE